MSASAAVMRAAAGRVREAGGALDVWGVLREDVYETTFGDGLYLHLRGMALNEAAAHRLAALGGEGELVRWHVRPYRLSAHRDALHLVTALRPEEEFAVADFAELLGEIPPGAVASELLTGAGEHGRAPGPHMRSLA